MIHHEHSTPSFEKPLHDEEDDSPEAIIERMKKLYEFDRTALDDLLELSRDTATRQQFETLLDDLTYEALSSNEEFLKNIHIVRMHVAPADVQKQVTRRQRELFDEYREAILQEAGISSELASNELDTAKARIKERIEAELDKDPGSQPHEILLSLGMLKVDEEGNEIFTYPAGLFPESTDAKWLTYLETVRTHLKVEKAVEAKLKAPVELEEADATRRIAHNAVSRDVDELLGLESLPSAEWDFEKTRQLLAKIRDSRFPTVETGEKFVTERAVMRGLIGEQAIKALRTRLSDLHK